MDKGDGRLHMLQRNNQQLSAELSVLKEENSKLEKELEDVRKKQEDYTDTVAAVDRAWQQLLDDINYLARRFKWASLHTEIFLSFPKAVITWIKEILDRELHMLSCNLLPLVRHHHCVQHQDFPSAKLIRCY